MGRQKYVVYLIYCNNLQVGMYEQVGIPGTYNNRTYILYVDHFKWLSLILYAHCERICNAIQMCHAVGVICVFNICLPTCSVYAVLSMICKALSNNLISPNITLK